MNPSLLTTEAKETLRKTIRTLRPRLLDQLLEAAKGEYRLDVTPDKAKLPEARRCRRERLESWIAEQMRGVQKGKKGTDDLRQRFLLQAVKEAAHTWINRLVMLRILEHHGLLHPAVITGGWHSPAYEQEFVHYAGLLAQDDTRGYCDLLEVVFAELALELPGLYGPVGLVTLFPMPAALLREVVEALNEPELASAWGDDMTLGWVYQYWNDPEREQLDAKITAGGKIEPHEIASKTQMFTERYMVEWLLENSLGLTWLCICKKNGWTPDAETVLPVLEARRVEWRKKREAGEVALDALMPVGDSGCAGYTPHPLAPSPDGEGGRTAGIGAARSELECFWKYYVPQPIPDGAAACAPASIRDVKLLDPACGSGHFLVSAFGLFGTFYEEERRHRNATWSSEEIAESILANNLHGIDIDPRAIQIAAAALWLKAKLAAPKAKLGRMNLVAPVFRLASLPKEDPAVAQLYQELEALGVPPETTRKLVESLSGVDHLGTLLRVDKAIAALAEDTGKQWGDLFAHAAAKKQVALETCITQFLDAHATESDLGLRLEGEQLAVGLRFVKLAKERTYDVVVGNPPYQWLSKTAQFEYVTKNYPRGKADLYAAFLERGLELAREGGISALLTMRGWMFLAQFKELRENLLGTYELRALADLDSGAFDEVSAAQVVLAVACSVIRRAKSDATAIAVRPTPTGDRATTGMTNRKRAGLLSHVGRYEFNPKGFEVIEGEPIVYWWTKEFLNRYSQAPKLMDGVTVRVGLQSGDNTRFVRKPWELPRSSSPKCFEKSRTEGLGTGGWSAYVKGAAGRAWLEPLSDLISWKLNGGEYPWHSGARFGRGADCYYREGIAFPKIGNEFSARMHRYPSIFGDAGWSVFPGANRNAVFLCSMNSTVAQSILESFNPTVNFQVGDVNRLPLVRVQYAEEIVAQAIRAFDAHESCREPCVEFKCPGPSSWRYAQDWAQRAVDRAEGEPLPPYEAEYDPPAPEAGVSFEIGVALGRFAFPHPQTPSPMGEGDLDEILPGERGSVLAAGRKITRTMLSHARELRGRQTHAEEVLWEALRDSRLGGLKFRRQHPVNRFVIDFYCHEARLAIELDGSSHEGKAVYDEARSQVLASMGARVLRFKNLEIEQNLNEVLTTIVDQAAQMPSVPPLQKERGPGGEEMPLAAQSRDGTLPAGILFISPNDSLPDSLLHPAAANIQEEWDKSQNQILQGKKQELRDWLRKDFFTYHKALYENRPIYFPLSSDKRSFVAYVSIHRWTDNTLQTLIADHLRPAIRQLDGEILDLNQARASSDKKTAAAAEKQYATVKRLHDELTDFIAAVTQCAERGALPTDPKCPPRKADATFRMDLDDGVMINSAALWPLLDPQWKDPKKWWKELCAADGRKDYDWSHLARRYFPERIEEKCKVDPSLAVAHGCFWKYHPAKAYAWELRLQDEIKPEFLIEEDGAAAAREKYLSENRAEAAAAREKEVVRRERKAAKLGADEVDDGIESGESDEAF